jgi:hypothetical protein
MKTGKTYWGIGQGGGREKQRERIRGERERSSIGERRKWHV